MGTRSYLPDFLVILPSGDAEWWEVKGYWTSKGRTAVKRFKKYYPDENLKIIDKVVYKEIEAIYAAYLPKWEY